MPKKLNASISLVAIPSDDVEGTANFFERLLDIDLARTLEDQESYHTALSEDGIDLFTGPRRFSGDTVMVYFHVDDLDATLREAGNTGGKVVWGPQEISMSDPAYRQYEEAYKEAEPNGPKPNKRLARAAVVQAPVVPIPTDPVDMPGLMASRNTAAPSAGPGTGGGTGTGAGTGLGEGKGAGIGPGQGGGTGGGPYRPGTGIQPPTLIREVKPAYTDEARRRGIEGDVVLEIVVRRDGAVGDVQVRRSLGAGLEQRAIDAVRQWRFGPARREGTPVDVVVEVSVEFKLR